MSEVQSDIVSWWYLFNTLAMTLLCLVKLRGFETRRDLVLYSVAIGFFWPVTIPLVAFMSGSDSILEVVNDVKRRKTSKVRK